MNTASSSRSKRHPSTFQQFRHRLSHKCLSCLFSLADRFMLLLGPVLIVLACGIIVGLTHLYFRIVLPMLAGTNWVTTHRERREYWQERGYRITYVESAQDEDRRISMLQSLLLALSTPTGILHTLLVLSFLANIIYNYYKCVVTSNTGPSYAMVVRELAEITGFNYPETDEEMTICKNQLDRSIFVKLERRRRELMGAATAVANGADGSSKIIVNGRTDNAGLHGDVESQQQQQQPQPQSTPPAQSTTPTNGATSQHNNAMSSSNNRINNNATNQPQRIPRIHNWQLLSPTEWSWCRYSLQPKPPRSHYDHVTKSLVLNMDHYCPWMFNVVGYFNYRYFFNFLWFVTAALFYGMAICYPAFQNLNSRHYREQVLAGEEISRSPKKIFVKHWKSNAFIPTPDEKTPVAFGFMMCLAVGIAVFCLGSFHLYLVLSAQTTIEFHGNVAKRRKGGWTNPYSAGNWKKNWEMIYGTRYHNIKSTTHMGEDDMYSYRGCLGVLMAMMPSSREPEFLPIPIDGKLVRRKNRGYSHVHEDKKDDVELGTSRDHRSALTKIALDISDGSTESTDSKGMKERAMRRSPQTKEITV
ncbi:hypothetical protein HJC23_006270 [Cyclotella cryptica]|uniref:Palmitoyltransferase n=1 Tax=Cyclotella cryptica TaxID=29204 RepID=A0ABD3PL99_9STRA|eukprot:CCRYP_013465-RA/>CCRYP_013465-RA protein AED:0.00 eAED:0.00 QI:705/1/1/1/0.33/0.25/4/1998/585